MQETIQQPEGGAAVRSSDLLGIRFTFKDACDIVYGKRCEHEWYQGKCIHCEVTPAWARSVMEANARLGVEHNRTVDAERKNSNLLAEVERLRAMMPNDQAER
jgi:hypothetical protein